MTTRTRFGSLALGLLLFAAPGVVSAEADETDVYGKVTGRYEAIRQAFLADSIDDVAEHARAIRKLATDLLADFSAAKAGVADEQTGACKETLGEIASAAGDLADTSTLESARESFFALTKPLVKYRKLVGDEDTIVGYCSMVQKAWIQPRGEIRNPYGGLAMSRCGQVVGE